MTERANAAAWDEWEPSRRRFLQGVMATAAVAAVPVAGEAQADAATSTRLRRWAMLIDLRQCDGCMELDIPPQCTQRCIWSRYGPEGHRWLEVLENEPEAEGLPGGRPAAFPTLCYQCENAPCVNVCPVGATFHTPEGTVLIDQERCIGCRLCMAACPYDRRFFNWEQPVQPAFVAEAPYNVRTQTPAKRGTPMKCDFCTERVEAGGLPACVLGCPRGAMYFGDLEEDVATNGTEIVTFSRFVHETGAYQYKEDLGTSPRVWYVPGSGEEVLRTHHEEILDQRLEWPWKDIELALAREERS